MQAPSSFFRSALAALLLSPSLSVSQAAAQIIRGVADVPLAAGSAPLSTHAISIAPASLIDVKTLPSGISDAQDAAALVSAAPSDDAAASPMEAPDEDAVKAMQAVEDSNAPAVRDWLDQARMRQASGKMLGVMEHTALLHILRSVFLEHDRAFREDARASIEKSWLDISGTRADIGVIIGSRLPRRALRLETHEARQFHAAVFQRRDEKTGRPLTPVGFLKDYLPMPRDALAAAGLLAAAYALPGAAVAILAGWLLVGSFAEQFYHRVISHPTPETKKKMREGGPIGRYFYKIAFSHSVVHHHQTFRDNYTLQFGSPEEKEALDQVLSKKDPAAFKKIQQRRYGLTIETWEAVKMALSILPFSLGCGWLLGLNHMEYALLASSSWVFIVHINISHMFEHDTREEALFGPGPLKSMLLKSRYFSKLGNFPREKMLADAGPLDRMFLESRYFAMVARMHYVHHMAPNAANFNLLPGVDLLFGTWVKPTIKDILALRELKAIF